MSRRRRRSSFYKSAMRSVKEDAAKPKAAAKPKVAAKPKAAAKPKVAAKTKKLNQQRNPMWPRKIQSPIRLPIFWGLAIY